MKKKMNPENCLEIIKAYLCVREGDGTPLDPEKMEYVPRICDGYALIYDHLYISDLQFKYIPGDKNQECRKIFFEIFENETFAFGAFKAGFLGRSFFKNLDCTLFRPGFYKAGKKMKKKLEQAVNDTTKQ